MAVNPAPQMAIAGLATALSAALRRKRENALLEMQMRQHADDFSLRQAAQRAHEAQQKQQMDFDKARADREAKRWDTDRADRLRSEYEAPLNAMLNQAPYASADLAPVMGKGRQYAAAPDSASFLTQDTEDGPVITFDETKPSKDMMLEDRAAAIAAAGRTAAGMRDADRSAKNAPKPPKPSFGGHGAPAGPGGKILPATQVNRVSGYASGIDSLERIVETTDRLASRYSGRLSAAQNTVAGWLNIDDPEITSFRAFVRSNLADYVREISGRAVTDKERSFLATIQPSENDKPETIKAKARQLQEWLSQRRDTDLRDLGAAGYNTGDFQPGYYKSRKPAADAPIPGSEEVK